jgi:hypothetical protein
LLDKRLESKLEEISLLGGSDETNSPHRPHHGRNSCLLVSWGGLRTGLEEQSEQLEEQSEQLAEQPEQLAEQPEQLAEQPEQMGERSHNETPEKPMG